MTGTELQMLIGVIFLVITAGLLGAAEVALTRITRARAKALASDDDGSADGRTADDEEDVLGSRLRRVLERRELVVATLFFVGLASHLAIATLVAIFVNNRWGSGAVAIALVVELVVLFLILGAARMLAMVNVNGVAPMAARVGRVVSSVPPLRWIAALVVVWGRRFAPDTRPEPSEISEEELLALADQAAQSDAIDQDEREYIESIIEFGDTIARQVMSPRPDMVAVAQDVRIVDVADVVIANGYSRIPVFADSVDDIIGIAHSKDIMRWQRDAKGDRPVSEIMRTPNFVPETKQVSTLLREMQAETFHIAIVVDEYGGTAGLLTMEDLIEELVGEIVDEFDVEQPMIERLRNGDWLVNGKADLDELGDLLEAELPEGEWSTVGGLIFSTLGYVPEVGEHLDVDAFRFAVVRMQGRRIARVRVSVITAETREVPAVEGQESADSTGTPSEVPSDR